MMSELQIGGGDEMLKAELVLVDLISGDVQ